jgi:transposase
MFSNMLAMFSMLSRIEVSYKTIERLYSDPEVMLACNARSAVEKEGH